MAEIYVQSSAALEDVISELSNLRKEFGDKANDINAEEQRLIGKWQGDASTEFDARWMRERQNLQTMYDVLGEYVEGLRQIKANLEAAEQKNVSIAQH